MKKQLITLLNPAFLIFIVIGFSYLDNPSQQLLSGAWHLKQGNTEQVSIFQDGYFSCAVFDKINKKFIRSYGGIYKADNKTIKLITEFDTDSKENVGKTSNFSYEIADEQMQTDISGTSRKWKRLDKGKNNLSGVWRITGRMVDGKINPMQRGDRKTLKILSGTRFQWMAINPATKEFFGTGGGTYTFIAGKYIEHIEFFSRDSARVGASLEFDGNVNGEVWNHSGMSSKGDKLNELWTRERY